MTLDKAITMLGAEYTRAKTLKYVHNPIAWALHQVWKKADSEGEKICVNCKCCVKGFYPSSPNEYVCTGAKEPFVISDIFERCSEYKRSD